MGPRSGSLFGGSILDISKQPLAEEDPGFSPEQQRSVKVFKEQLMVCLMRRLLRAKGKATGSITIPVSEVDDTAQLMMYFKVTNDGKRFELTLEKKQ
jgi:hypothetical protein